MAYSSATVGKQGGRKGQKERGIEGRMLEVSCKRQISTHSDTSTRPLVGYKLFIMLPDCLFFLQRCSDRQKTKDVC